MEGHMASTQWGSLLQQVGQRSQGLSLRASGWGVEYAKIKEPSSPRACAFPCMSLLKGGARMGPIPGREKGMQRVLFFYSWHV